METHKPKAAHSWREFGTELFTVVLGIVIAICLEQTVEYFHWRHEVTIGRKDLVSEIASTDAFYAFRIRVAPCLARELDQADALIRDIAANRKPGKVTMAWRSPGQLLSDSEWQSERSSQTLTHFPREELALMSKFYAQMADMRMWEDREGDAWAGLNVLRDDPGRLGPADLALLRVNLHEARKLGEGIPRVARTQLATSDKLGIQYRLPAKSLIEELCDPEAHLTGSY